MLASPELKAIVQIGALVHQTGKDEQTGKPYNWKLEETLIELGELLAPDPETIARKVTDPELRSKLMEGFNAWHDNFIPTNDGKADKKALEEKLSTVVDECRSRIRAELVRKNQHWVLSNIPRRIHDFKFGLYNHIKDRLYDEYCKNGGEDSEPNLIRKIALFNRVLEDCYREELLKPNGTKWKNDDEIWQCWIGFAGSENEARRVCRTMDTVFKDLDL